MGAPSVIDPIVQKVLLGTIIYGICLCFAAGGFQLYRNEKKSALFLLSIGTVILVLTVGARLFRISAL